MLQDTTLLQDITCRQNIELLVNEFYNEVRKDATIGPVFDGIIGENWDTHLPKMYKFWSSMLLNENSYNGNPMAEHVKINQNSPFNEGMFDIWFTIWTATVNKYFQGPTADETIMRAKAIKQMMVQHVLTDDLPSFMRSQLKRTTD